VTRCRGCIERGSAYSDRKAFTDYEGGSLVNRTDSDEAFSLLRDHNMEMAGICPPFPFRAHRTV